MGKKNKNKENLEDVGEVLPEDLKKDMEEAAKENGSNTLNIDEIDEQAENQSTLVVLASVVKKIGFGADLTSMTIPGSFILAKSSLSYFAEYYSTYFDVLLKANDIQDNQERFLQVYKYLLTTTQIPPDIMKKPLNPVLGETYDGHVRFHHDEDESQQSPDKNSQNPSSDSTTPTSIPGKHCQFFSEQISHHPPISCTVVYNKEAGIYVSYHDQVRSTFLGTYAKLTFDGFVRIRLEKFNETYTVSSPSLAVRLFRNFCEYIGKGKMSVSSSKLRVKTTFHPKPLLYGSYHAIESIFYNDKEKVLKVKGQWTEQVKISEYKKNEYTHFFDRSTLKEGKFVVPEAHLRLPTDSTFVWGGLFDEFNKGSPAKSITREKTKVEEEQRKITAERKKKGEAWIPKHFDQDKEGNYTLKNFK